MTTKNYITKAKNQFKSSAYYVFWSIATVAVVSGQIYVGTGYRRMSESLDAWFLKTIEIMIKNKIRLNNFARPSLYYNDPKAVIQ